MSSTEILTALVSTEAERAAAVLLHSALTKRAMKDFVKVTA